MSMKDPVNPRVIRDDIYRHVVVLDKYEDLSLLNAQHYAEEYLRSIGESRQWVVYERRRENYDMVRVVFQKADGGVNLEVLGGRATCK